MTKLEDSLFPNLRMIMFVNGDTQRSLSKEMGISVASFVNKITGKQQWTLREIKFICNKYDKKFEEIF